MAAPVAWSGPDELAAATGLARDLVEDLVADLEAGGVVAGWEVPAGVFTTLTPLAAAQLGVRLVEVGPEEVPRWAGTDVPDSPPPRARRVFRTAKSVIELLQGVDDDPAEIAAESEIQPGDLRTVPCLRCVGKPRLCARCRCR